MKIRPSRLLILLALIVLLPVPLLAIEILEADHGNSIRLTGPADRDIRFGEAPLSGLRHDDYLLGSFYTRNAYETALVFGFRVTETFLQEWEKQGRAEFLFSIIEFHEGDARRICPIRIERLKNADSASEAAESAAVEEIGKIEKTALEENRIYRFSLTFDPTLKAGDMLWVGMNGTLPQGQENYNLVIAGDLISRPGGTPPLLITGTSEATSRTVQGMSLLQSLNRRFSAPKTAERIPVPEAETPRFINPLRTKTKLEALYALHMTLERELSKLPEQPLSLSERFRGIHSIIKPRGETWTLRFPVNGKESSIALYPAVRWNGKKAEPYAFPKRFIITAFPLIGDKPVMVADWSRRDFPLPGITPVIFPFRWQNYKEVEINVQEGAPMEGGHAFALAEVTFSRLGYNISPVRLDNTTEEALENSPFWSADYATDSRSPFGTPTQPGTKSGGTFRAFQTGTHAIQLIVSAPKSTIWGSLEFYPTIGEKELSPAGFPAELLVELSDDDTFSNILHTVKTSGHCIHRMLNSRLSFAFHRSKPVASGSPSKGCRKQQRGPCFNWKRSPATADSPSPGTIHSNSGAPLKTPPPNRFLTGASTAAPGTPPCAERSI